MHRDAEGAALECLRGLEDDRCCCFLTQFPLE